MIFILPILALASLASGQSDIANSQRLQDILSKAGEAPLYSYPTSFTQGIIPKALHSHNDYWRPVPFYSALAAGAISVEADVWLTNGTLYVGHEISALTQHRTFDSLYIQPILSVLHAQNPQTVFVGDTPTKHGVYDTSSGQTLYLFVDVKTDGARTFPAVIQALEPLRSAGYLTRYEGTATILGPVTVIGTGNTPLQQVQGVSPRDYFWDAPIPALNSTFANITKEVSPIASADFAAVFGDVRAKGFNSTQIDLLKAQVTIAHSKGIMLRYWDQPGWPVNTRDVIWRTLWDSGVDLLNVDDLEAAASF